MRLGIGLIGSLLALAASCGGGEVGPDGGSAPDGGSSPDGGTSPDANTGQPSPGPIISRFSASPPTLPAGGGAVTLSWQVSQADSVEISGIGAVTGSSRETSVSATTIFTLTARNTKGTATASTAVVVGQNPSRMGGRFVAMVAPVSGERFIAPTSLRLVAAGRDPNVDTNSPSQGLGGNAARVQFFVDDELVLERDGGQAEYWVFKGFVSGVGAGLRRVWARAIYVNPPLVLDSLPVLVEVAQPPSYARTVTLDADVTISGAAYELIGTPAGRVRVDGNGHRIVSGAATSTRVTLQHVDFYNLGSGSSTASAGIDITTSGDVLIEGCNFDGGNPVELKIDGAATATLRGNTFRSNMRQPLGQNPDGNGSGSFPVLVIEGQSTGAKLFQGNNVGAGWVLFDLTKGWLIGGDDAGDGNVLIGPRVGIYVSRSQDIQIRRNYSHHIYYGGWSQGSNYELGGLTSLTAEHNVIVGSSWPVRGVGGEFRYNLVLEAGHQWLWADHDDANVHHNLFIGGDNDIGGIYVLNSPANVRIRNNTIDQQGLGSAIAGIKISNGGVSLTSNLFLNVPRSPVALDSGSLTADYNLFWSSASPAYSDQRTPAHDVSRDPLLTDPAASAVDFDETMLWTRTLTVREILADYRGRYTPQVSSPALDAGDPAGGAGNDIGAVGGGTANPADQFGR